jgi:entericidin B
MLKKILAIFAVLGFLAGCNTMEGVGKDVERGGEKMQGTAKDTKEKM